MTDIASSAAAFTGLVDLAAIGLGGTVLGASDDFFASANNLIEPGRGIFVEGKFTDRGKWMDGWESRRRRGPGYDWCVLELGAPGTVLDASPTVACGDGAVQLVELQRAGKRPMPAAELMRGFPLRPGMRLQAAGRQ